MSGAEVDGSVGLSDALASNRAMVKEDLRSWLLVAAYFLVLILIGASLLGIGLVVTFPLGIISLARLYDRHKKGFALSGTPPLEEVP